MKFEKGDIVQVHYTSPARIEMWMKGWEKIGPGDLGVVLFDVIDDVKAGFVTVMFPLIGTQALDMRELKIVAKASEK